MGAWSVPGFDPQAAYHRDKQGKIHGGWRFHTHFKIDRGILVREERDQLRQHLEKDRCYVMDLWYDAFALWNDMVALAAIKISS